MAEARFPINVDRQNGCGEFIATVRDAGLFNRQFMVVHNAKMEMNALHESHWSDGSEPLENGVEMPIDDDRTSVEKMVHGKSTSMHLGEFVGALLRGFSGV